MPAIQDKCKDCKFFIVDEVGAKSGTCHWLPPVAIIGQSGAGSAYPPVWPDKLGCGQFKKL